jgi:hypothetical protein
MVRRVTPELSAERIGPPCVQMTRAEAPGKTVLHLVAYQPDRRTASPQVIESPPAIAGVQVRLRGKRKPAAVRIEPGGTPARAERSGPWLTVSVPPFTIHTAVVFDWE